MATQRITLVYPEALIKEPVLFQMVKEFDVIPNIRRARVSETVGEMVVELNGNEGDLERAVAYLREQGVQVDAVEGDVVSP